MLQTRGAQISGTSSPGQLNFVWWCIIFVGPQNETCFMSPVWHLDFENAQKVLETFWPHDINSTPQEYKYLQIKDLWSFQNKLHLYDTWKYMQPMLTHWKTMWPGASNEPLLSGKCTQIIQQLPVILIQSLSHKSLLASAMQHVAGVVI